MTTMASSVGAPESTHSLPASVTCALAQTAETIMASRRDFDISCAWTLALTSLRMSPSGFEPGPLTVYFFSATHTSSHFIFPSVSVPVLSEQITLTLPRLSIDGSFLTIACLFAIDCAAKEKLNVTTMAKPSGITDTASDTLMCTMSMTEKPRMRPTTNMIRHKTTAMSTRILPSDASFFCRRVFSVLAEARAPEILPTSVDPPVATTTAFPRPLATSVDMKAQFLVSPRSRLET
mmetsp:Transcript_1306/g.4696  ORF Transcript_1306/g.4696 Transcript_1306/m.4696 type:complete len:235 (-) Transcript_1306:1467-2171(-)